MIQNTQPNVLHPQMQLHQSAYEFKEKQQDFSFQMVVVFYQWVKTYIYIIIFAQCALYIHKISSKDDCPVESLGIISMAFNGSIAFIVFNLIGVFYILSQNHFAKIEFYVMFGLNFFFFSMMMIHCIWNYLSTQQSKNCEISYLFRIAYVYISIKNQIEVFILMSNLKDKTVRQINICSNTVFAILFMISPTQRQCIDDAESIVFSVSTTNVLAFIFFTLINYSDVLCDLHDDLRKAIKFCAIMITAGFLMVYIMVVYYFFMSDLPNMPPQCIPLRYVMRSYLFVVPFSLLGMFFVFESLGKLQDSDYHNWLNNSLGNNHAQDLNSSQIVQNNMLGHSQDLNKLQQQYPFNQLINSRSDKFIQSNNNSPNQAQPGYSYGGGGQSFNKLTNLHNNLINHETSYPQNNHAINPNLSSPNSIFNQNNTQFQTPQNNKF